MSKRIDLLKIFLVGLLLFALIFPLSYKINFFQNDDWVYYKQVTNFLNKDFVLDKSLEAAFYTQGFMAMGFARMFSLVRLPILTLLVSVLNFIIFTIIVYRFYVKKLIDSLLIGLTFFFAPLHIYSALGFMTDNYFLLFLLLTLLFSEYYLNTNKKIYFVLVNMSALAGFFVRQLSVISLLALITQLVIKKKYVSACIQTLLTSALLVYYFKYFPTTSEMNKYQGFRYTNLTNFGQLFTLNYVFVFYALCFVLPILVVPMISYVKSIGTKKALLFVALSVLIFCTYYSVFSPKLLRSADMYFIAECLGRSGFFYGDTMGLKYHIINEHVLFTHWQLITEMMVAMFLSFLVFKFKKVFNIYFVYALFYMGVMSIMLRLYDRYMLPLIPIFLLGFLSLFDHLTFSKIARVFMSIGLFVLIFYVYNLAMDFVLLNGTIYANASTIHETLGVKNRDISAGYAWQQNYCNRDENYKYMFYFQPLYTRKDWKNVYEEVGSFEVKYPLNFFDGPKVYLFKRL